MDDPDRTASLMTPAKLAQVKPKAAASPAAWLDQMAADAGHAQVRRLAELRRDLEAAIPRRDVSAMAGELLRLSQALPLLDFDLLQARGWWARATGKSRSAGAEFASQFEKIDEAAQGLAAQVQALLKQKQEQAGPADRTLLEVEVEFHAIDKTIDQATRWLHDMRNQLKTRQAAAADEPSRQQIRDEAARCEILVARLKALRAVSSAAQKSHQHARAAAARHAGLLQTLQQTATSDLKAWRTRLSALSAAASGGDAPGLSLEAPQEAHRDLQRRVEQALADCDQLRQQEDAFAQSLSHLGAQLEAVL